MWQELQAKIAALEAECTLQPRDSQSRKRAKFKAVANDLLSRFAALEAGWLAVPGVVAPVQESQPGGSRSGAAELMCGPFEPEEAVAVSGEGAEARAPQDSLTSRMSGELVVAPDTCRAMASWPWRIVGQTSMNTFPSQMSPQGWVSPSSQASSTSPGDRWHPSFPAPLGPTFGVGVWLYPLVPDMGYNSVPLKQ